MVHAILPFDPGYAKGNNPVDFFLDLQIISWKVRFWEEAFMGQRGAPLLPEINKPSSLKKMRDFNP